MPVPASPSRTRGRLPALVAAAALVTGLGLTAPSTATAQPVAGADLVNLDPFAAVDPWIGTAEDFSQNKGNAAYGNTWPGATVPFGMVQSSPTTFRSRDGDMRGGYEYSADKIRGFGMNRLSGTGCVNRNGAFDFPVLPYAGPLTAQGALPSSPGTDVKPYYLAFDHADEVGEPGYYSVDLANGVSTELTATTRTAISRFDFPADADSSTLIFNTTGSNNSVFGSGVTIEGSTISGWVETAPVCEGGGRYKAYYSATFDQPIVSSGTWTGGDVTVGSTSASAQKRHGAGVFVTFPDGAEVTVKAGLSYVSIENAAENATTEAGHVTFDEARASAETTWRDALSTIDVAGGTEAEQVTLYTALYHSLLHPNTYDDVNGEYFGYDGTVRQVEPGRHHYATYSGWDMYRGQAQLVAMLFPDVASDINQSIVDLVGQSGYWPNWPHLGVAQQKMSGDSLPTVLSVIDAFGSTDYDREAALAHLVSSQALPLDPARNKRDNGYQFAGLGFVENAKNAVSTSTTLEYATNDFSIAQLAQRLGDDAAYDRFMQRAQNWQNVFDPVTREIRPRGRNGFDRGFNLGERGNQFDQATGYQYGWAVPQNMSTLIAKRGGVEKVTADLDKHLTRLDAGVYNTPYAYMSNQPSTSTPWVYHWLQQPAKTTDALDRARAELFTTAPTGVPGNDDLGSLSSWFVWSNLGLYPAIFGRAELLVSSPAFDQVTITSRVADGAPRVISLTAPGASSGSRYVDSLRVDGVTSSASWLPESFTQQGGTLDLTMRSTPGTWGTGKADVPPSFTDGSDVFNNIGTTTDGKGATGSIDASDNTLSRADLAAAGATPGARLPLGTTGVTYTWPDAAPGAPDNWIPHGQSVPMGVRVEKISFLGLATNGPAKGTATVVYTDGTRQDVQVELTDWTPGTTYQFGNLPVVTTTGRNKANGTKDTTQAKVFGTVPVSVDPTRTIESVILPQGTDKGVMHLFAVGTSEPIVDRGVEVVASARAQCTGRTGAVVVRVVNDDSVPLDVVVATAWGTKTFSQVAPGRSAAQTFSTRSADVEAGSVTVTARPSDAQDVRETVTDVEHAAVTCGQ
ncbi:GH92 family glycosyl hydrolase [Oerskovia enterophila]|uniref:Glycosyl hydrolase family 92 n=1 Tax=Oerskovia enterophila TaxID=43678 RepID=A0A163Q5Y8_9CELL|nr:GH92 family glycosyl hydrolase [Oerskovia enterophila]KZM33823.1 glycosyl hydrolase family 92 [Oerskovia enterophila]